MARALTLADSAERLVFLRNGIVAQSLACPGYAPGYGVSQKEIKALCRSRSRAHTLGRRGSCRSSPYRPPREADERL